MKKIKVKKHKYSSITLIFIYAVVVLMRIENPPGNPISWDTFGYYLYLPFTFIYHDPALHDTKVMDDILRKYQPTETFYQATQLPNGNWIMKYSMGMAVLYSPAFFSGHLAAKILNYPADGFSRPYQIALVIYSILFFMLGLFYMRKVLLLFFNEGITSLLLLLLFFGTNYFTYVIFSGEIVHNYIFTMYALILWQTYMWHQKHNVKNMLWLALLIGLTTLARPSELVAILIPLLWGVEGKKSFKEKIRLFKTYSKQLVLFVLVMIAIGSLQIIYWKIYSGHFFYYSYGNPGEGFEFLWPYTLKVLFSFRKGWLIYTPMMIFALWGFYFLYKEKRDVFYSLFVFFIINLYVVSSWSCWWYAQCFGQRALVQSYAILIIPFGYFLKTLLKQNRIKQLLFGVAALFFIWLNLFQIWQLRHHVISGDRMTFAYYWKTFGKTEVPRGDKKLLLVERNISGQPDKLKNEEEYKHKILKIFDFENSSVNIKKHLTSKYAHSGKYSLKMDSTIQFSPSYKIKFKDLTKNYYAWLRVSVWVYPVHNLSETSSSLIVSFQHNGENYKYRGVNLNSPGIKNTLKYNQWNKISIDYLTPEVRRKSDNLIVYLWNQGKKDIYFDDLKIELFNKKKNETTN